MFTKGLWRSVKYEDTYFKDYESGADCQKGLTSYFTFYRHERPHQGLGYRPPPPWEVHNSRPTCPASHLRMRVRWSEKWGPPHNISRIVTHGGSLRPFGAAEE